MSFYLTFDHCHTSLFGADSDPIDLFLHCDSAIPTREPTANPTAVPSTDPSATPSANPTTAPSADPTASPSIYPTSSPSGDPTAVPTTSAPTTRPTEFGAPDLVAGDQIATTLRAANGRVESTDHADNQNGALDSGQNDNIFKTLFFVVVGVLIFCCFIGGALCILKRDKASKSRDAEGGGTGKERVESISSPSSSRFEGSPSGPSPVLSPGMSLTSNSPSALNTRGLTEMMRHQTSITAGSRPRFSQNDAVELQLENDTHSVNGDDLDELYADNGDNELYGGESEPVLPTANTPGITVGSEIPTETEMETEGDRETAMPSGIHISPGNHSGVVLPDHMPTAGLV